MLSQCICYTSETYQILSPVLFQLSLFLIHRIFIYLSLLFFHMFYSIEESIQAGALLRPKNGNILSLVTYVTWGIKCALAHVGARLGAEYSSCIIFVVHTYVPNV